MSAIISTKSALPEKSVLDTSELSEAQSEFVESLRISLSEMKQGKVQPAREALREIRRELESENNGNRPDC